jgi:peptidyl-prolyl cis-trans isomerase A (cyclophilin A)
VIALLATVVVGIMTTAGEIDVRVDTLRAPKTSTVTTHPDNQPRNRAKIDVIQATHNARAHPHLDAPVVFEPTSATGLRHRDGTVSMARDAALNTAQTDFFICIGDQPSLDDGGKRSQDRRGFAAFGQVGRGMDVVRKIHSAPQADQQLKPAFPIVRIRILGSAATPHGQEPAP